MRFKHDPSDHTNVVAGLDIGLEHQLGPLHPTFTPSTHPLIGGIGHTAVQHPGNRYQHSCSSRSTESMHCTRQLTTANVPWNCAPFRLHPTGRKTCEADPSSQQLVNYGRLKTAAQTDNRQSATAFFEVNLRVPPVARIHCVSKGAAMKSGCRLRKALETTNVSCGSTKSNTLEAARWSTPRTCKRT